MTDYKELAQQALNEPDARKSLDLYNEALAAAKEGMMNDTERLDLLEDNQGCALVSDDDGRWAVACDGFQSVTAGEAADIETTFFIEKRFWQPTIREAIDAFKKEREEWE